MTTFKEAMNKYFSAGLGKKGQIAAWGTAIGLVAAWSYYDNKNNGKEFTDNDRERWNAERKKTSKP